MKIVTGLTPHVEKWSIKPDMTSIALGGVRLAVPRTPGPVSAFWALSFASELDSLARPRGVAEAMMLFASEPRCQRREVDVQVPVGAPDFEAYARRQYSAPVDAVVLEHPDPHPFERWLRLSWWEVEV